MPRGERNVDDDSFDESEELLLANDDQIDEEHAYFPVEESKPPHY